MDAQSVKTVEESASISGYDGHKRVKGRKRHLRVDTLGLPLSILVTSAGVNDKAGAWRLLAGLAPLVPRLTKIWADEGVHEQEVGALVPAVRRLGTGDRGARLGGSGLRRSASAMGGGAGCPPGRICMAGAQPPPAHRLRAEGADERSADPGRDRPPRTASACEACMISRRAERGV